MVNLKNKRILKFNKVKNNVGNILFSCFTAKKNPLYCFFIDSLKNFDISSTIYLGNDEKSEFQNYFENYLIIPSLKKNNKQKVLKILKKFKIKLVIPTSDLELVFWSSNKNFFKKNKIEILVSNKSSIINCQDKYKFAKYCIDRKIPAIKILNYLKNKEKFNCVIKERFAQHKKKALINVPFNKVNILKLKFKNPIIQKYIKGKEISADIWIDDIKKENNKIVLRERSEVIDGESKVTTIIHEQKIEKEILNYANKLNLKYHILIQAIIDNRKKIHIIECNPRFGGASTASIKAGLPSIYNSIYIMLNSKQRHISTLNRSFSKQFKLENVFFK